MTGRSGDRIGSACSERTSWWAIFIVLGALTTVWSLSTPIDLGTDEQEHTVKAVAVARGQLQTATVDELGPYGISIPQTRAEVPEAYDALQEVAGCWRAPVGSLRDRPPGETDQAADALERCVPPVSDGETVVMTTFVGTYPPTYYALVGWPSLVLAPTTAFYAMRAVSGLLSAAFLASALMSAASLRQARLVVPAAALGATPLVLFLSGSINPNGLEVTAACAAFTSGIALLSGRGRVPRRLLVRTVLAIVTLAGIRSLGPAFAAGTVIIALLIAGDRATVARLWADRAVRAAAAVVAVCVALAVGFTAAVGTDVITVPTDPGVSSASLALGHLESLPTYQVDAVGRLAVIAAQGTDVPRVMAWAWVIAVVFLAGAAVVVGRWRDRAAVLLLIAATAGLPVVAQLVSDEAIPWYGRYTLAVSAGLPVVAALAVSRSAHVRTSVTTAAGAVLAVGIGAVHLTAIERQLRVVEAVATTLPWSGPVRPMLLLAAGAVAAVLYAASLLVLALRSVRPVPAGEDEGTQTGLGAAAGARPIGGAPAV